MATKTVYGGWCATDDYRAQATITYTEAATSYTISTQCAVTTVGGYGYSGYSTSGSATVGSTTKSGSVSGFAANAVTNIVSTGNVTVNRTHAAQTITCKASVTGYAGTSTASTTISVPARASYTITFNDNGGSGGPGTATKWNGEALTIPATVPTRANYKFLGWGTSSTATSATYQPNGTYPATSNAAATLYAVWQLALVLPSFGTIQLYRTTSGTTTKNEDGTSAYLSVPWSVDTATNGNTSSSKHTLAISYVTKGSSTVTTCQSQTLTGTSGTFAGNLKNTSGTVLSGFATGTSYDVTLTLTDAKGASRSTTVTLTTSIYVIHATAARKGKSIGIGQPASQTADGLYFADLQPYLGSAEKWRTALGLDAYIQSKLTWTQLATSTNTTAMSYDLANYVEVLFVLVNTNQTTSGNYDYVASATLPVSLLRSSPTYELYLGGGRNGASNTSGRSACLKVTSTTATPVLCIVDNTNRLATANWYVYAR